MGGGHSRHDRQPQSVPGSSGPPPPLAADEGLTQGLHALGRHQGAVVTDRQPDAVVQVRHADRDPPAVDVVVGRIAQQVGDALAQQHRIARDPGGQQVGGDLQVALGHLGGDDAQGIADRGLHVHVLSGQLPGLGVGQVQQGVDRLPVSSVGLQHPGQDPTQVLGGGLRV